MTKVELHDRLRTRCVVACVDPETMKMYGAGRVYRDEDIGRRMCNEGEVCCRRKMWKVRDIERHMDTEICDT